MAPTPGPDEGTVDAWDPTRYEQFLAQRRRPFDDLASMVDPAPGARVVDLGCGPATLTAELPARWATSEVVAVDNSPAMLAQARRHAEHLTIVEGDLADRQCLDALGSFDVVMANASLQWVADHPAVLASWTTMLRPGGQLAVQVPANGESPAHVVAHEVSHRPEWLAAFGGEPPPDPVMVNVLSIEAYSERLETLGFGHQCVRAQIYAMHLDGVDALIDWLRGTTLTRFERVLDPTTFERFVTDYTEALRELLDDASPYFYPFKRYLFWGRLADMIDP